MNTRAQNSSTAISSGTVEPERIGDVEVGADAPASEVDELGLNASERAAWDAMEAEAAQEGAQPAGEAAGDGAVEGEGEGEAGAEGDPEPPKPGQNSLKQQTDGDDDDDDAPAAPGKPGQTVSRHKYSRDIKKRDTELAELRAKVAESGITAAKLEERLNILNQALTAPPPKTPEQQEQEAVAQNPWLEKTIDPAEDAIQALAQMQRRQEYSQRQNQQQGEYLAGDAEDRQLRSNFAADIAAFAQSDAGKDGQWDQAYAFLKNSRLTEIAISLFDKDPNDPNENFTKPEIDRIIRDFNAEEKWVVSNAISKGKSPAQAIMRLAKGRQWKYEAPQQQQAAPQRQAAPAARQPEQQPAPRQQNGAAQQQSAVDKINSEIEGAAAARSLSDGGGAPPAPELTLERILKMGDKEFAAFADNISEERLAQLMGKPQEEYS